MTVTTTTWKITTFIFLVITSLTGYLYGTEVAHLVGVG